MVLFILSRGKVIISRSDTGEIKVDNQHSDANDSIAKGSQRLKVVLVIVLVIMVAEVIGGMLSNSLAIFSMKLISDF